MNSIFSPEFLAEIRANAANLKSNRYQLCEDTIGEDEIVAATRVLGTFRLTMGTKVKEFEAAFAKFVGSKYAFMVNSGSSANLVGIAAMLFNEARGCARLQPGDEVLVPALSWPTTVWPLAQLGLKPVYVDINTTDLAVSLDSCRAALTPKTKAIFLIHVLGAPTNMDALGKFCKEHDLALLEDCCESLGASWNGTHVGNFGAFGSFSLYYSHHMSTIEGGMITTNSDHMADTIRSLRAHGWTRDRSDRAEWAARFPKIDDRFLFVLPGFNLRPMELQAAIGLEQIKKLPKMLEGRKQTANKVIAAIEESGAACRLVSKVESNGVHSWMAIPLLVKDGVNRREFCEILDRNGVETRPIIAGNLALHPASQFVQCGAAPSLGYADKLWGQGFMIGCHPNMRPEQLQTLKSAFAKAAHFASN